MPTPKHARLLQLHHFAPDKLINVMHEYDEINSLLVATGRDTADLQSAIKLALQATLLLMATTEEAMSDIKAADTDTVTGE